jgi:hypothetical protein
MAAWAPHNKPDLGNLIINAFDRIYTSPLLTFRAFRRSATISLVLWLLMYFVPWFFFSGSVTTRLLDIYYGDSIQLIVNAIIIVVMDYVSLFFVRRFLYMARIHPVAASVFSSVIGLMVVTIGLFMFRFLYVYVDLFYNLRPAIPIFIELVEHVWSIAFGITIDATGTLHFFNRMLPAFIIHLWLPLFALSSLVVQLIFWVFRAVEWAQWFLKQGDAHPLKAIGIVATIIVFGSAMLVKEGWALLGVLERS